MKCAVVDWQLDKACGTNREQGGVYDWNEVVAGCIIYITLSANSLSLEKYVSRYESTTSPFRLRTQYESESENSGSQH